MKTANLETGKQGESMAAEYLTRLGHKILHRNWKSGKKEIDIISHCQSVLHFTEVKTRKGKRFGYPEGAVDFGKINHIRSAAAAFLELYPQWKRISIDIISIELNDSGNDIRHFSDLT